MADTTSRLPEEDKPKIRPDLRNRESLGTNPAGSDSQSVSTPAGGRAGGGGSSTAGGTGGATSGTGGGRSSYSSPSDVKNAEESPIGNEDEDNDQVGRGYKPGNSSQTSKGKVRFRLTRRRAAIAGVGTTTVVGAIFGISSISSGPAVFVHISQLLDKFHFSSQQDAEDSRLMKIARYIHEPSKPQNTRMGLVGNKVANSLTAKMTEATGLTPDYNSASGRFNGYAIDRNHDNFAGKTDDEIKAQLARQYGVPDSAITGSGDHMILNPDTGGFNTFTRYYSQVHTSRTLLGEAGYSRISAYVGTRVLKTRAGWTFHPIQTLDAAAQAKVLELGKSGIDTLKDQYRKARVKYITTGVQAVDINASNDSPKNSTGQPSDPGATTVADSANSNNTDASQAATDMNNGTDSTQQLSDKLSAKAVAGGAAGAAGLFCVLEGLNAHIQQAKFDKADLPMMRMAGDAMSTGSQTQDGNITALQLNPASDRLTAKNKNGDVTSTWNQAKSIQAELGEAQTGPDIPQAGQVFDNTGPFAAFLNSIPLLGTVCSALGSPFGIALQIFTGPIGALASFATGPIINEASAQAAGWLSGAPVNPLAAGADYGNYINYGARLAADQQFMSVGGIPLSPLQEKVLGSAQNSLDQSEFNSKSIAYRIFNTNDSQTLASHLIDNYGSTGAVQNMASMTRNFGSIFANVLKVPATLLSGVTHAAPQPYNWHGLKKVGFTTQELSDKRFENPFDNACYVAGDCKLGDGTPVRTGTGILSGPNGSTYIDRANTCFGVKITGDGTAASPWTVDSSQPVNFGDENYTSHESECKSSASDWLRVRFWLLDTQTIEGYDCFAGGTDSSDQSCTDVGFGASTTPATTTTTPSSGGINISAAQQAAQQASTGSVKVGFALYDSTGKQLGKYNETTQNYGASITKSMLLVAYLKQVGSGSLSSSDKSELTAMIENSDNGAADWVYSHLHNGRSDVEGVASAAGMSGFSIDTSDPIYVLGQSKITADDFAKFFAKIDTYMPASQKSFGMDLLSHLSSADQNGLLKANLPGTVYSKEGWKPEPSGLGAPYVVNQAAQFSSGGTTYGIAVTVGGTSDQGSGEAIVQKIATALLGSN